MAKNLNVGQTHYALALNVLSFVTMCPRC